MPPYRLFIGLLFAAACVAGCDEAAPTTVPAPTTAPATNAAASGWRSNVASVRAAHERLPDEVTDAKVASKDQAEKLAMQHWFAQHGLLAEEGLRVRGLHRVGRDIPKLAKRGEWVWEVRVEHLGMAVDGWVMVNANTGEILSVGATADRGR